MLKKIIKISALMLFLLALPGAGKAYTDTKTGKVSSSFSASLTDTLIEQRPEVCGQQQTTSILVNSVTSPGWSFCIADYISTSCTPTPTTITETYEDTVTATCFKEKVFDDCDLVCAHENTYNYTFLYQVSRQGGKVPVANTEVHKCEAIDVAFNASADWGANLDKQCKRRSEPGQSYTKVISVTRRTVTVTVPPTDILNCADQTTCLTQAKEHQLSTDIFGRGVQKVPASWIANTQKSLTGNDQYLSCVNGICQAFSSGKYNLSATAAGSVYYGQCRGFNMTLNTPGANVAAVTSSVNINVVNQAPKVTVDIPKDTLKYDEEVEVVCNAIDPDCPADAEHKDKIAKIKWTCVDYDGEPTICRFKNTDGSWARSLEQPIPTASQANSYQAKAAFKILENPASDKKFTVTCEAWDNDPRDPKAGKGSDDTVVKGNGNGNGNGNQNVNGNQNTNGVVNQNVNFNQNTNGVINSNSNGNGNTNGAGIIPTCHIVRGGSSELCNIPAETTYTARDNDNKVINISGATYDWSCGNSQTTGNSSSQTCTYGSLGTFKPTLTISKDTYSKTCTAPTPATTVKNSNCQVKVRKAGTGSYASSITVERGDRVEAKLDKECLTGGATTWYKNNSEISGTSDSAQFTVETSGGIISVDAKVEKDARTTQCTGADVTVKESFGPGT